MIKSFSLTYLFLGYLVLAKAQKADDLVGNWISLQKNVVVRIVNGNGKYNGTVIWFDDTDNPAHPMKIRKDLKNPNKRLRSRNIIGLPVVRELLYNKKCRCWENGKIYDVQSGKTWNASIMMDNLNSVKVRGFWHFEFLGRSMQFRRLQD